MDIVDTEYKLLVNDILTRDEFQKIEKIEHHQTSRLTHSLRVSYFAYKFAKKLKLDYVSAARGGLLHDFFMSYDDRTKKERFLSVFTHPKYALINASNRFNLNDCEKDIIRTHMFPINIAIPKYLESWLVSLVDKIVTIYEFTSGYKYQLSHATTYLYISVIINMLKLR